MKKLTTVLILAVAAVWMTAPAAAQEQSDTLGVFSEFSPEPYGDILN